MSHTPRPFTVESRNIPIADTGDYEGYLVVRGSNGHVVYERFGDDEQDEDDAAFIVRACNAHDDLLAVCKEMHRALMSPSRQLLDSTRRELAPWLPMLEAAIAKADITKDDAVLHKVEA